MPEDPAYQPSSTPGPSVPPPPVPPVPPGTLPMGTPGVAPTPAAATTLGLEPNIAAGLAVIFSFIGGIVFLALEKRSEFVRFWAAQSTVVGVATVIVNIGLSVVGVFLGLILHGSAVLAGLVSLVFGLVGMAIGLLCLVLYIIMIIKAFTGQAWDVPVVAKYARLLMAKFPV